MSVKYGLIEGCHIPTIIDMPHYVTTNGCEGLEEGVRELEAMLSVRAEAEGVNNVL